MPPDAANDCEYEVPTVPPGSELVPAVTGLDFPPGRVHGGVSALVLDHMLGEAASEGLSRARFTGTITVKYLRGTPLGPLRCDAWIDRTEGAKAFAKGTISDAEGVTVEAEGVFIEPAWARDIG